MNPPTHGCDMHYANFALLAGFLLGLVGPVHAQDKSADQKKIDALSAEVQKLKAQIDELKKENARLRDELAARDKPNTPKPIAYELGPAIPLGNYSFNPPADWIAQNVKDSTLAKLYRSPDKGGLILVRIRVKGSATPEMFGDYSRQIITMLNQEFTRGKIKVFEPPTIQPDKRFFLRVREKISSPDDKVAEQIHLYRNLNRDMIEVTAIATSDSPEQSQATFKLAEDLTLSVKPTK